MSQQPTMQTSPATPAVMPTFDSALAAAGLAQHATALRELGCLEREDLLEIDADDVASLGLSSSDLDRLRQAAAQPQPRAPSTQRATAAASAAATASAGRSPSGPPAATLDSALAAAGLTQHATALRELGCQEAEDLVDLEEGDVASIGLSSSDLDRLRDAAAGKAVTCTATTANPRPSGQPASSAATLDSALSAAGLTQHATALRELGCQEAEDLVDLEEGDVASIGLSSSDLDRLRDAAAGKAVTCTATAANPRPSGLEVPSTTSMDAQPEATTTASATDNAHAAVDTGQELQPNVQPEVATTASADDSARAALMSEEELLAELVRLV
jgi:hypothetical protein